ncbi:hypothetical protein [Winogradskyella forsetii]|uniref:hypothetical protein n=1 Tax=Winogradskyella forsetii TaxID=2686077 RepID=UPI0015BB436A|nr:hypothetical protein [Winogradskyella forsetii]
MIIAIGLIYGIVVTAQKGYYKYKYFKTVEKDYVRAKDSIKALNFRLSKLTEKQTTKTKTVQKASTNIDKKLKQDEATIDNSVIDDTELNAYITKHEGS